MPITASVIQYASVHFREPGEPVAGTTLQRAAGPECSAIVGALHTALHCTAPMSLATMAGLLWDEHSRAAYSIWRSWCSSGSLSSLQALVLQCRLLPTALLLALLVIAWQWTRPALRARFSETLICQASCLLCMLVMAASCSSVALRKGSAVYEILGMSALELSVSVDVAFLCLALLGTRRPRAHAIAAERRKSG